MNGLQKTHLKTSDIPNLKPALFSALSGHVRPALDLMGQIQESDLSSIESDFVSRFKKRFLNPYKETSIKQSLIGPIQNQFHSYWHSILMGQMDFSMARTRLDKKLLDLAESKDGFIKNCNVNNVIEFLKFEIKKEGFFSKFFEVRPFFNLMIWKGEEEKSYNIDLDGEIQNVKVVFLNDFIELGWAAYATLNVLYVGGWATKDKLFCVKPAYDIESENFKVSYLAHEARHYSDYQKFPKLQQLDLEYRAKLTELYMADVSYRDVLDKFYMEQKPNPKNPHAHSSYLIMNHLSEYFNMKNNILDFYNLDKSRVKEAAKSIFVSHTQSLTKKNPKKVLSVLL